MAEQLNPGSNINLKPSELVAVQLFHVIAGDAEGTSTTRTLNPFNMPGAQSSHVSPAQSFPLAPLGPNRPGA